MEKTKRGYPDEELNLRSFYLRLLKKIWILPAAGVICALLFLGIYTLVTVTFGPAKSYESSSQFYIKFAYDENAGTLVDHYNAYTWNSLMSSNEVLDKIMEGLKARGINEMADDDEISAYSEGNTSAISRKWVVNDITAEIPSDVRVLLVTVRDNDRELADNITAAVIESLESYGETNEAFDNIKLLNTEKASLDKYTDRSLVAAIFGAVVGVVVAFFALLLLDALDDAIYVPEDCERRYKFPVIGILFKDQDKLSDKTVFSGIIRNDLTATFKRVTEKAGEVYFIATDSVSDEKLSEADLESLKKALGNKAPENIADVKAISTPGTVLENYRRLTSGDGVIISIPYGKKNASLTDHTISQLKKHDCKILGIVISRADDKFIKRYYRL
jgi:capsular polysaccharide biosynthesis protein/SepF-like predicted cell division protein (DUF552 family)